VILSADGIADARRNVAWRGRRVNALAFRRYSRMAQNPELIQPLCSAPEKPVSIKALDFDFSSAARFA
jgi:hypothetical protein